MYRESCRRWPSSLAPFPVGWHQGPCFLLWLLCGHVGGSACAALDVDVVLGSVWCTVVSVSCRDARAWLSSLRPARLFPVVALLTALPAGLRNEPGLQLVPSVLRVCLGLRAAGGAWDGAVGSR